MSKLESTPLLAKSVFRWLQVAERYAKSRLHPSKYHILVIKTHFQTAFEAPPAGTRASRGNFLPILYECDHIESDLPEDDIKDKLGQYYMPFRASLQDAEGLLGGIIASLEPAGDNGDQTDAEIDGSIRKPRLKRLLLELQEYIDYAILSQKLSPGYNEWQKRNSPISWLLDLIVIPIPIVNFFTSLAAKCCGRQSKSGHLALPTRGQGSEVHRTTLTDLYTALSRTLQCRCHFVHLGLCSAPVSSSESSSGLENPGSIYYLFITHDLSTSMTRYVSEDPPYLKASRHISNNGRYMNPTSPCTASSIGDSTPGPCSSIITSPPGSTHRLQCETPTKTEFLVESALHPVRSPPSDTPPNPPSHNPILTLHDILASHSQKRNPIKLRDEDRLLLADKLARWVLQYYDTPWLHGLGAREIRFFTRHENDTNYANWTPYISASFTRTLPECRKSNNELCALGSVLLQLGLNKLLDNFPDIDSEQNIKIAFHFLPRTLGMRYTRIVEKLLSEGAKGDRMEGEQIDDLTREIRSKVEKILDFYQNKPE